jgi:4-amino-4-deoxy-L-arabinose transferase-like glycosyltransferase
MSSTATQPTGATTRDRAERLAAVAVIALAAALRLVTLARTPLDPFYDAAVRSMGTSWHALLVGAFEPSAGLAIDKPPLDLWLQVASTKLIGFSSFALLAPAALGGTLTVVALYDLLRTLAGRRVALAGALALAVLPVAVISARSDTMDSVMAALLVGAYAIAARGLASGRVRHAVAAGALLGLAFEVKLFEALVAAVPLALMWWLGARESRARRLRAVGVAAAACAAAGLAWLIVVTIAVPARERPWAFGSSNGSAWNAAFVYDGWDRLVGAAPPGVTAPTHPSRSLVPAAPGPLRLLSAQDHVGARIGVELTAAWAALALVAATRAWRRLGREGRAGLAALAAWLALGTVLFSVQGALRPRYLEAFDPAVAACLGIGAVLVADVRRVGAPARGLVVAGVGAVLLLGTATSMKAVRAHVEDSGAVGAQPAARVARLSAYLRAHQRGARYEVASLAASPAAPLIVRDARPVLVLTAAGHQVVSVDRLARLVAAGRVREALVGDGCRSAGCLRLTHWIRKHGIDVSRAAGEPHARALYALDPAGAA